MHRLRDICIALFLLAVLNSVTADSGRSHAARESPWPRHTIDNTARGADGVRFADVNADGWPDAVVGWEESGIVRLYLHPGPARVKIAWPAVTIGKTPSVEDAVLVDLDQDGDCDVVSSCEGRERSVFIHWSPSRADVLSSAAWRVESVSTLRGRQQFMFCQPADIDGIDKTDLVLGGKGPGAELGWLQSPGNPRDIRLWRWYPLRPVGWIMSLVTADMDGDGDLDILFSDRKGSRRGCFWLERPDNPVQEAWTEHAIGCHDVEPMFLALGDLDGTGTQSVVCATAQGGIHVMRPNDKKSLTWELEKIPMPEQAGTGKAVAICDVDEDGRQDLVVSCEHATGKCGVFWLAKSGQGHWAFHDVSGPEGIKFDLVQAHDLDGDGDVDLVTTEEQTGLGVIWYENPLR